MVFYYRFPLFNFLLRSQQCKLRTTWRWISNIISTCLLFRCTILIDKLSKSSRYLIERRKVVLQYFYKRKSRKGERTTESVLFVASNELLSMNDGREQKQNSLEDHMWFNKMWYFLLLIWLSGLMMIILGGKKVL